MQSADSQARGCDFKIMEINITSDFNSWLCAQQPQFESQPRACAAHKVIFLSGNIAKRIFRFWGGNRLSRSHDNISYPKNYHLKTLVKWYVLLREKSGKPNMNRCKGKKWFLSKWSPKFSQCHMHDKICSQKMHHFSRLVKSNLVKSGGNSISMEGRGQKQEEIVVGDWLIGEWLVHDSEYPIYARWHKISEKLSSVKIS